MGSSAAARRRRRPGNPLHAGPSWGNVMLEPEGAKPAWVHDRRCLAREAWDRAPGTVIQRDQASGSRAGCLGPASKPGRSTAPALLAMRRGRPLQVRKEYWLADGMFKRSWRIVPSPSKRSELSARVQTSRDAPPNGRSQERDALGSGERKWRSRSTMTANRTRENRLRRTAAMHGLKLRKSRRRDPAAPDCGRWCLINEHRNTVVLENVDLDQVEAWLNLPWAEKLK